MARRARGRPPLTEDGAPAACAYCERLLEDTRSRSSVAATREHTFPRSKGGTRWVWACVTCNGLKGAMLPEEWAAYMAANPQWWRAR